jgi:hypothetical protein
MLCEQSPWCQWKWWAWSWLLHLSRLFQYHWVWTFYVRLMLSSPKACLIIARVSVALFPKCALLPLDPSRNHIRRGTQLQIKGHKNQYIHPAAWNFLHWLQRYASISLLQVLKRWQDLSQKLWIQRRIVQEIRMLVLINLVRCFM